MDSSFSIAPQAPPPWPSPSSSKAYNYRYDCSLGVCSFQCPQWCFLPPPPPLFLNTDGDDGGGGSRVSPLMAALIAVLAAAFLVLFYFTVISRFCRNRRRRTRRGSANSNSPFLDGGGESSARVDSLVHDPARPDSGLDDAFIRQITVFKFRREDKLVEGTECAVCLNEFGEGENLRLMPNCEHAFHLPCIDTWLKTHSNCPLCRSSMNPVPPAVRSTTEAGGGSGGGGNNNVSVSVAALRVERSNDVVLVIREVGDRVQVVEEPPRVEVGSGGGGGGGGNVDERERKLQVDNN